MYEREHASERVSMSAYLCVSAVVNEEGESSEGDVRGL